MEAITDPVAVAAECCEFGKRRMGSMQPKTFRRYDVAAEHEVWFSDGMTARSGRVTAIDGDGRYTVVDEEGGKHEQLKREQICHQWQLEEMDDTDGPDAAGMTTCRDGRRAAEIVLRLAVTDPSPKTRRYYFDGTRRDESSAAGQLRASWRHMTSAEPRKARPFVS